MGCASRAGSGGQGSLPVPGFAALDAIEREAAIDPGRWRGKREVAGVKQTPHLVLLYFLCATRHVGVVGRVFTRDYLSLGNHRPQW